MENDMETKEAKGPVTAAEGMKVDVIESISELYTSGIERLAEVQKKGLELAVKQNAEVAVAWKKFTLPVPGVLMLDLATTAFERFAETQKGAIDLMVEQTSHLLQAGEGAEGQGDGHDGGRQEDGQEAIEHSIAAQKTALDYTTKQAKAAFETAKQQLGLCRHTGWNCGRIDGARNGHRVRSAEGAARSGGALIHHQQKASNRGERERRGPDDEQRATPALRPDSGICFVCKRVGGWTWLRKRKRQPPIRSRPFAR